MNILLIAPYPPPHTGNTLPIKILKEELELFSQVELINLNKESYISGVFNIKRFLNIFKILIDVYLKVRKTDFIYLTVAESFLGNLRDIFIYTICFHKRKKMYIHMFGGFGMAKLLSPENNTFFKINKFFISKIGGVIVEGQAQEETFSNVIKQEKIHIVSNFSEDYLFISKEKIESKFNLTGKLNILFLSNLLPGKGHIELFKAFSTLPQNYREKMDLNFVGSFDTEENKSIFIKEIESFDNINYLGPLYNFEKKKIYENSHIFCLPTYYPFEGQPFCIIEAYANACVVLTTYHSGIPYVFKDKINGFKVEKNSINSIQENLKYAYENKHILENIAITNYDIAVKNHTEMSFKNKMLKIFNLESQ
jgi:glycosyltransferase involved in cell wall biosynthesis